MSVELLEKPETDTELKKLIFDMENISSRIDLFSIIVDKKLLV